MHFFYSELLTKKKIYIYALNLFKKFPIFQLKNTTLALKPQTEGFKNHFSKDSVIGSTIVCNFGL